jgi:hypothetical protein
MKERIHLLVIIYCEFIRKLNISNTDWHKILVLVILNNQILPNLSQLVGSEKTMEQFLDRLLHESVYDRRIRPFYTDSKSKCLKTPK